MTLKIDYREVHSQFQAQIDKNSKGKQVKGIPNPHYKRKRNFSKFERGESSQVHKTKMQFEFPTIQEKVRKIISRISMAKPKKSILEGTHE